MLQGPLLEAQAFAFFWTPYLGLPSLTATDPTGFDLKTPSPLPPASSTNPQGCLGALPRAERLGPIPSGGTVPFR